MKMTDKLSEFNGIPRWQMLDEAISTLYIHNFIGSTQKSRLRNKIIKLCAKEGIKLKREPEFK